ncbi:MAG: hypothetical protein ABEN55_06725 [Bradymonadaceae bacterium]
MNSVIEELDLYDKLVLLGWMLEHDFELVETEHSTIAIRDTFGLPSVRVDNKRTDCPMKPTPQVVLADLAYELDVSMKEMLWGVRMGWTPGRIRYESDELGHEPRGAQ